MSASRERKKRQEFLASGGMDRKAQREAEQRAAERKSTILYSTIAILFVAITAFLLVYNSGILQRKAKAVTVDGETYTADDAAFYYYESYLGFYNSLINQYGSYGPSLLGLDPSQPLSSQNAFGSTAEDAQTWEEYFKDQAVETMRFVTAAKKAAKEDGYSLTEEDQASIDSQIENMKSSAKVSGTSYKNYLVNVYGPLMTTKCFESNLEDYTLATSYANNYSASLTYTEDEVQAVYDADPKDYDNISYLLVTVNGSAATTDEDGNTIEPTEEEKEAAWEEAKTAAQALLDAYNAGEDLEEAAKAYEDIATYSSTEKGSYGSSKYVEWCYEDGRQAGDTTIIEDEDNSRCYVVVFNDRFLDETKTVDVRHILINEDSFPSEEDVTDEEIKAKAEEILASWDGTEEGFAQLAMEYSQDSSASSGGLYTNVPKGQMVESFEEWIFDDARQSGDTGIVKSEYGYHIIYFVGNEPAQWYTEAESTLRDADYGDWYEELVSTVGEATVHDKGMGYVS